MSLKFVLPCLFALVLMMAWGCLALADGGDLPGPLAAGKALWRDRVAIFGYLGLDVAAMILGFILAALLGVATAIALTTYRGLRLALEPWMLIGRMAPIVALAPIVIIYADSPFLTLLLVTTAAAYFPLVSVATPALMATNKMLMDLFKTYHASYWQEITLLRLPHALPQLMTALKRAAIYAPIAALLTDYLMGALAGRPGLGQILQGYFATDDHAGVAALCLASAGVGIVMAGTVHAVAAWTLMHWHDNENGQA